MTKGAVYLDEELFQLGQFKLHSGKTSSWKIECDALSMWEWEAIATMFLPLLPAFGNVVGIPRGGVPLARALIPHVTEGNKQTLLVDDVLTTGGSMERARLLYPGAIGAVLFARGPVSDWIVPLFTMRTTDAPSTGLPLEAFAFDPWKARGV